MLLPPSMVEPEGLDKERKTPCRGTVSEQRTLQDYSQSGEGRACSQASLNCLGT